MNRASDTPSARDYTIRVSRRAKYMQLRLTRDGTLEVVLPEGAPLHPVPAFVQAHRNWITRARARHGQRQRRLEDLRLELPEHLSLPGLGEEWALTWNQMLGLLPRIRIIAPGQLEGLADTAAPAAAREHLRQWVKHRARSILPDWLERVSQRTGLAYTGVAVRGQRSRWGSCSSHGNISLNYKLLFLEPELIDYLMVHELCHTRHMNHSPRYWALVASMLPGYRHLDRELRRAAARLPDWVGCD